MDPAAAADTREAASLGGQYEKLLTTVGNLQGDLQRTVGVCQVLLEKGQLRGRYTVVACISAFSNLRQEILPFFKYIFKDALSALVPVVLIDHWCLAIVLTCPYNGMSL